MSWIRTIPPEQAGGDLARRYRLVAGPDGQVDNILQAHSLRPHTLDGHMGLYKAVLHHSSNRLPKATLEALGVFVSALNRCEYCVRHHATGLRRLMADDPPAAERLISALTADRPGDAVTDRERPLFDYARRLTRSPDEIDHAMIEALRSAGWDDGELLEVNQVVSYFAYANRTVLGLGVETTGETLGLSPGGGGDESWSHG